MSRALAGKRLLTRKDPNGQLAQLTLDCKLDADGDPVFHLPGSGIAPRSKVETEYGGNKLKIKLDGETLNIAVNGEVNHRALRGSSLSIRPKRSA